MTSLSTNSSTSTISTTYSPNLTGWIITEKKKWFFSKLFGKEKKYDSDTFFSLIKNWLKQIDYNKALKYKKEVIKNLKQAESLWQKQMIETLNEQLLWFKKEIQIISRWFNKYVFESDIADLESVGIQWKTIWRKEIQNYVSVIPSKPLKEILRAKKYNLFNEIIIIYTRNRWRELELDKKKSTTNEKRKKVDPIAFWLVRETGRLFIIADWMDDECDFDVKKLQTIVDIKSL